MALNNFESSQFDMMTHQNSLNCASFLLLLLPSSDFIAYFGLAVLSKTKRIIMEYQYFTAQIDQKIANVTFNRPAKANAINQKGWKELQAIFEQLSNTPEARVIVLSGAGKHFCAGIDLEMLMSFSQLNEIKDEGRKREQFLLLLRDLQATVNAIENCRKPVIAAIHSGCIGGGLDIAAACDMRFCTGDAYFTIKEIDMGMVADLGSLQRLPKIIPFGKVAEMAYTGRRVGSSEAQQIGLVNQIFSDKTTMMEGVQELATTIAAKSPLSIRGVKESLLYARDHSVKASLEHIQLWNAAMFLSNDLMTAFQAGVTKQTPNFED